MGTQTRALTLDDFFTAILESSPFAVNRVSDPSQLEVDVRSIHQKEFDQLISLAHSARQQPMGIGALVVGGAGVGKSHLLARLARWAAAGNAFFVYLHNIQVDPADLRRYVVKCVVSELIGDRRNVWHETTLFQIVDAALQDARRGRAAQIRTRSEAGEVLAAKLGVAADSSAIRALIAFFIAAATIRRTPAEKKEERAASDRLAIAVLQWLSGDPTDRVTADAIGISTTFETTEDGAFTQQRDQHIQEVLLTLCQLAKISGKPLILCFDQVDNLRPEQFQELSRFVHALLDAATNFLTVVCGNKESIDQRRVEGIINEAAYDRLADNVVFLQRVTRAEGHSILEARLELFCKTFSGLPDVSKRRHADALFPLSQGWYEKVASTLEVRPRDVLRWGREAWEELKSRLRTKGSQAWLAHWPVEDISPPPPPPPPPDPQALHLAIDQKVDAKIEEHIANRVLQPSTLPPDANNLSSVVRVLLEQCLAQGAPYSVTKVERPPNPRTNVLPAYSLVVHEQNPSGKPIRNGVTCVVTDNATSAGGWLRRMRDDGKPPERRLLITEEERRPLRLGAKGSECFKALVALGTERFQHWKLSFRDYAALDALTAVVGLAKSGDLEVEPVSGAVRPVTAEEVIASHHRCDRYRKSPLLRELLTEETTVELVQEVQLDQDHAQNFILAQLSLQVGMAAIELTKKYLATHPELAFTFDTCLPQIKVIAERMHTEGLLKVTPWENDLFLTLRAA